MIVEKYRYKVSDEEFLSSLLAAEKVVLGLLECVPSAIVELNLKLALREVQSSIKHVQEHQQLEVDRKVNEWRKSL